MKIINKIKYSFRRIKWSFQRIKKGYSDWDTSEIDTWFLDILPNMLEDFKKMHQGIPECVFVDYFEQHPELGTYKDFINNWDDEIEKQVANRWNEILDRMIFCFNEADEDRCILANDDKNHSYDEIYEYCDGMLKEGFELFYKYFHNLWN